MKKIYLFFLALVLLHINHATMAQADGVGIGTVSPDPSAILHIQPPANNRGLLIPRLDSSQMNSLTPTAAEGLLMYNTKSHNFCFFYNGKWETVGTPRGGIIMWSGSIASIPTGWALCDGSNGTPDLRDRFIVGAGNSYTPGNTGGTNTVTLTSSEMPSHSHGVSDPGHTHSELKFLEVSNTWRSGGAASSGDGTGKNTNSTTGAGLSNISIQSTGGNQAHENRPPYYALAYIMKL